MHKGIHLKLCIIKKLKQYKRIFITNWLTTSWLDYVQDTKIVLNYFYEEL